MRELKYSEILKINKKLENNNELYAYDILLLSNVIVHQAKEIIEYTLRMEDVNATVELGNYDNIVQESQQQKQLDATIIFWELSNLIDGLQYKIELLNRDEIDAIEKKIKSEINFTLKNLESCPLVLINQFSSFQFSSLDIRTNILDNLAHRLNHYLESCIYPNLKLVNIDKIIASIGIQNSFDSRYYYSSKAPYTIEFFKAYSQFIKSFILSVNGKSKKALIFDCDNTIWKGVLGEDGFDNIEMSLATNNGSIFAEIQSIALSLSKQGVLIGLCSKNNPEDVKEVLTSHPDMILSDQHITITKINWSDKVTNLREISKELNIGLDSLVFVDDSPFEVNLVREMLPEVMVLQVPQKIYEYPKMIRRNLGLFYNHTLTEEDSKKTTMYKEQAQRERVKLEFSNIDGYLASLELKITVFKNDSSIVPRISQMCQKTNQFNLTTKRYTEVDIQKMVSSLTTDIYAFSVEDKYGESGITGLCILNIYDDKTAEIDSLLMSCRVIGRNIEYVFMDYIFENLKKINIRYVKGKYLSTNRNIQVKSIYNDFSFKLVDESNEERNYLLDVEKYKYSNIDYIEVMDERRD
jgi:FkbH-like protein